jgi:hypothetical protein
LVTVDNLSDQVARVCKRKFSLGTTASHAFEFSLDVTQLTLHLALQTEELFIPQNKGIAQDGRRYGLSDMNPF